MDNATANLIKAWALVKKRSYRATKRVYTKLPHLQKRVAKKLMLMEVQSVEEKRRDDGKR